MHTITLVEGRKSTGKSSVLAAFAAAATGGPVPPGWEGPQYRQVIWESGEDDWENVVVPRLAAAGADLRRVARMQMTDPHGRPRRPRLPDDILFVQDFLRDYGACLLILDPFVSLCSPQLDMRVEQQARMYLEPLSQMLPALGASAILSRHVKKGTGGDAREAGLGSVAVANVARSILRCDEHPHERGRFVLSVVACNYGPRRSTQVYEIGAAPNGHPRIEWLGDSDLDADAIAEGRGSEAERDEWSEAERLLCALIGNGWMVTGEIFKEASSAGISDRMLRRAKSRLRIPSRRQLFGNAGYWEWGPPPNGWPAGLAVDYPLIVDGGGHAQAGAPMGTDGTLPPQKQRRKSKGAKGAPPPASPPPNPESDHANDEPPPSESAAPA